MKKVHRKFVMFRWKLIPFIQRMSFHLNIFQLLQRVQFSSKSTKFEKYDLRSPNLNSECIHLLLVKELSKWILFRFLVLKKLFTFFVTQSYELLLNILKVAVTMTLFQKYLKLMSTKFLIWSYGENSIGIRKRMRKW